MKLQRNIKFLISHILVLFVLTTSTSILVYAQDNDTETLKKKAVELLNKDRYVEAVPYLEKLVLLEPENAQMSFYYGFALLAKAKSQDKETAIALRIRARKALIKAKELGSDVEVLDALIESMPPDGKLTPKFSENAEAESLMNKGEAVFTQGKYDEALKLYAAALQIDPKIYHAALFSGDMYLRKEEFDKAEIWYQKAITINPNLETAYRYSATPLMKQGKYEKAKERYVEAFIVEPYNNFARAGLVNWSKTTKTRLAHPRMDIPKFEIGEDGKAKSTISLGSLFGEEEDPAALSWIGYTATRTEWHESKFKKAFPNAKEYRHTLTEEAEALRSVIEIAKELQGKKKKKKIGSQFRTLIELDEKGLLESYILLAIPDRGIAQDHAEYLKNNRTKLRQYVMEYVIVKKQ